MSDIRFIVSKRCARCQGVIWDARSEHVLCTACRKSDEEAARRRDREGWLEPLAEWDE